MDNLKNTINSNKVEYLYEDLPPGDLERFISKARREGLYKYIEFWKVIATVSSAAVIAIFLIINSSYFNTDKKLLNIYTSYIIEAVEIVNEIKVISDQEYKYAIAMVEEDYTLMSLLPEEMNNSKKITIVKEYYSRKLEGLNEIKKSIE